MFDLILTNTLTNITLVQSVEVQRGLHAHVFELDIDEGRGEGGERMYVEDVVHVGYLKFPKFV